MIGFWPGSTGIGGKPLDLICRDNLRKTGIFPAEWGFLAKFLVLVFWGLEGFVKSVGILVGSQGYLRFILDKLTKKRY